MGNTDERPVLCREWTVSRREFFAPGVSLLQVIFMEFMLNIRHIFYGLSLLEAFCKDGKKRLYMIFSLTDETYSLFLSRRCQRMWKKDSFIRNRTVRPALLDHRFRNRGTAWIKYFQSTRQELILR